MDPQRPQQPTVEPTPASPAPTQTSPVTPEDQKQLPIDPAPPVTTPPLMPAQPKPASNKKWLIAILAVVVAIAGLIFLFLSPWSPFVSAAPAGPVLMVGSNKYVNACSVLNKDVVTKELNIKADVNKENASETFAFDPSNSKDKQVDLIKQTDSEMVYSTCTLKLDRIQQGSGDDQKTSFINVAASIQQFPDDNKASDVFKASKTLLGTTKTLPSFADNSYYAAPVALYSGQPVTVQPNILHKNLIIKLSTPVGDDDSTGEQNAKKLDAVAKDMISRIDQHQGDKPKSFNKVNALGKNNFTDTCTSVNYVKVAAALGDGTQLDAKTVSGNQAYAPDNDGGKTADQLTSACTFSFRTQYEADQAKNYQPPKGSDDKLSYDNKFPHYLSLQAAATENKDKAKALLDAARSQAQENAKKKTGENDKASVEDVKLGDGAIKVTLQKKLLKEDGTTPEEQSLGQLYYITSGANVYIVAATYIQQDTPYKSQAKTLSLDQVKQIYKEMTMATKRAN